MKNIFKQQTVEARKYFQKDIFKKINFQLGTFKKLKFLFEKKKDIQNYILQSNYFFVA